MPASRSIVGDLNAALIQLRVEFAYCQFREFPMFGLDGLRIMASLGLCTQAEADAAITAAQDKVALDEVREETQFHGPQDVEGVPLSLPGEGEEDESDHTFDDGTNG